MSGGSFNLGLIGLASVVGLLAGLALAVGAGWVQRRIREEREAERAAFAEQVAQRTDELAAEREAAAAESARLKRERDQAQAERDAAQARVDDLAPLLMLPEGEKRYRQHWDVVDLAEDLSGKASQVAEANEVLFAHTQNLLLKLEFIRSGGNKNAPWAEIVRWKQKQENGK